MMLTKNKMFWKKISTSARKCVNSEIEKSNFPEKCFKKDIL